MIDTGAYTGAGYRMGRLDFDVDQTGTCWKVHFHTSVHSGAGRATTVHPQVPYPILDYHSALSVSISYRNGLQSLPLPLTSEDVRAVFSNGYSGFL